MKIIPVIDLKNKIAVSASQGNRDYYQPIKSNLSASSHVEDIIDGFLSIYPFKTIYIADLNAITNTGSNQQLIDNIIERYNTIEFWIDSGRKADDISITSANKYRPILGSESQTPLSLQKIRSLSNNYILSLDFFPTTGYSGPSELLNNSSVWPDDIIIMNLGGVGTNSGPDIGQLECFCQQYPEKNFIAAGGIRNKRDLLKLKEIGVNYALVASALHSGVINRETIKKLISI
jgi:phosphoribosylformimino-5-aminoimidazole carboxamide ribotide isomerase